jgi:hypothetical protein
MIAALVILNAIGCALTTITAVSIWAALVMNTKTVGHPEDQPGQQQQPTRQGGCR